MERKAEEECVKLKWLRIYFWLHFSISILKNIFLFDKRFHLSTLSSSSAPNAAAFASSNSREFKWEKKIEKKNVWCCFSLFKNRVETNYMQIKRITHFW